MASEKCPECAEPFEPGYQVCWRCGTGADGTPPLPDEAPARALACLRCNKAMVVVRRMKFHEGTRAWPFLFGEVGELFVNRESFDAYACTGCGKVEFFVTG